MILRPFWIIVAVLVGVATHIITVLYLPGLAFNRNLASLAGGQPANTFFLMQPETQSRLVPSANAKDIVGLCMVDLSKGKIVITPHVPKGLWNFTIYSQSGQQAYGINDVETASDTFSVELSQAKTFLQQIRGSGDDEAGTITNIGWHAQVNGTKALAVLWVPVPEQSRRKAMEDILKTTNCDGKPGP